MNVAHALVKSAVSNVMLNKQTEIVKPWGHEVIWAQTDDYVGKLIFINKGHKLSRQYHNIKEETILVKSGVLTLEIGARQYKREVELTPGSSYHIKPNTIHRFCANYENVVLVEVSTPHLNDVVRLEDDCRRK